MVTPRKSWGRFGTTRGLSSSLTLIKFAFADFLDLNNPMACCLKIWSSSKGGRAGLLEMGDVEGEVIHVEADEASVTVDAHEFVREMVESDSEPRERGPSKRSVATDAPSTIRSRLWTRRRSPFCHTTVSRSELLSLSCERERERLKSSGKSEP